MFGIKTYKKKCEELEKLGYKRIYTYDAILSSYVVYYNFKTRDCKYIRPPGIYFSKKPDYVY